MKQQSLIKYITEIKKLLVLNDYKIVAPNLPNEVTKKITHTFGMTVNKKDWGWLNTSNAKWRCCIAWENGGDFRLLVYVLIESKWVGWLIREDGVDPKEPFHWFNAITCGKQTVPGGQHIKHPTKKI